MAEFKLDREWLSELQSNWLRLSKKIRNTDSLEDALYRIPDLKAFLSPLIGELLFRGDLWINREVKGEALNAEMARIRFTLNSYLVDSENIVEAMEADLLSWVNLLTPGTKEYKEDKGATLKDIEERKIDPELYAWNRAKGPFLRGFQRISGIFVDNLFPFLDGKMGVFEEFYKEGYDEEISFEDVKVTFFGKRPCTLGKVKKYAAAITQVSEIIKSKGFDKIWTGRIYILCGKKEEGQFGVQYYSPPKDVIFIYEDPGPLLVDSLLYAFGNKYYYGQLSQERRKDFKEQMAIPQKNFWGVQKKTEGPDFARFFVDFCQERLPEEVQNKYLPFLKEDFFKKRIEQQSREIGLSEIQKSALKVASIYLSRKK